MIESGVLKGLNLEDMKRAGQRLILQDGCRSFFQKIVKNDTLNTDVHVLSYCWCGDLIRSAFSSGIIFTHTHTHMGGVVFLYNYHYVEKSLCKLRKIFQTNVKKKIFTNLLDSLF